MYVEMYMYAVACSKMSLHAQGNACFKLGEYESAVESYTKAMELDPHSAVMPANRAMAYLKLER